MLEQPITVGQLAPDFSLSATVGKSPLTLAEVLAASKIAVLAFYVLDFTGT